MLRVLPLPTPARLLLVAGAIALTSAAPAVAAPLSMMTDGTTIVLEVTDPPGDRIDAATTSPKLDLVAGRIEQDRGLGMLRATVTFEAPPSGAEAWLHVGLGVATKSGECVISPTVGGTAHLVAYLRATTGTFTFGGASLAPSEAMRNDLGTVVTLDSPRMPELVAFSRWSCARFDVDALTPTPLAPEVGGALSAFENTRYDSAVVFAPNGPAASGPTMTPGPDGKLVVPDADTDGVPDATDQCPTVAGARTDGCATAVGKASLRLSGRRVSIDRLLPATGEKCPAAVRVAVQVRARRVGTKRLGVVQHGRLCHVQGSIALKSKAAKVKVVVSGTGIRTLKRNVRR